MGINNLRMEEKVTSANNGHRGQTLLPTLNPKTTGLSSGKRASPLAAKKVSL